MGLDVIGSLHKAEFGSGIAQGHTRSSASPSPGSDTFRRPPSPQSQNDILCGPAASSNHEVAMRPAGLDMEAESHAVRARP